MYYVNPQMLPDLDETQLMAFLLSCHKDGNTEGRADVRREYLTRGGQLAAVYFDVEAHNPVTGLGGYFYPSWLEYKDGDDKCPYCSGKNIGPQTKIEDVQPGQRLICFDCGSHGPYQLC
jgi:hypothetical protein